MNKLGNEIPKNANFVFQSIERKYNYETMRTKQQGKNNAKKQTHDSNSNSSTSDKKLFFTNEKFVCAIFSDGVDWHTKTHSHRKIVHFRMECKNDQKKRVHDTHKHI